MEGRSGRRRPGHAWRVGDQALCQEDPPPVQRQNPRRICRIHRRRLYPLQPLRSQARAVSRQPGPAAVELAKDWRTDKFLRHLEALLLVCDKEQTFLLSGQGDVIEPDGGIAAIGSGGPYAQAAAQALAEHTELSARQIAEEAMKIAGKMCIYTNDKVTIEEL